MLPQRLDESALRLLKEYDWPGNVRELQNVIERVVVCYGATSNVLTAKHFDIDPVGGAQGGDDQHFDVMTDIVADHMTMTALRELFASEERRLLMCAMEECGGNKSLVAKKLDISRTQLYNKLREYGIENQQNA